MNRYIALSVLILTGIAATYFCNPPEPSIAIQSQAITVNNELGLAPSQAITDYVKPFKDSLDSQMNVVICYAPEDMTKGRPQSLLSNFVADLLLQQANKLIPTHIAVVNMGGLRYPILKGDITVRSIFAVMPFENAFVVVSMSGDAIWQLATEIVKVEGEGFAGMHIVVKEGELAQVMINGKPLDKRASYSLATSDYLLTGKDGLTALLQHKVIVESTIKIRDLILNHIRELTENGKQITATIDDRYVE